MWILWAGYSGVRPTHLRFQVANRNTRCYNPYHESDPEWPYNTINSTAARGLQRWRSNTYRNSSRRARANCYTDAHPQCHTYPDSQNYTDACSKGDANPDSKPISYCYRQSIT